MENNSQNMWTLTTENEDKTKESYEITPALRFTEKNSVFMLEQMHVKIENGERTTAHWFEVGTVRENTGAVDAQVVS